MSNSYQNEIPNARINTKLDLHTGGPYKTVDLPLATIDFSHGHCLITPCSEKNGNPS